MTDSKMQNSCFPSIQSRDEREASKHVIFSPAGTTVDFISPNKQGMMRIRNVHVPISTNALRFMELRHIEDAINDLGTMPDFGYGDDNVVI